jgi:cytoskeletal protein CcmA (bactofilin family)
MRGASCDVWCICRRDLYYAGNSIRAIVPNNPVLLATAHAAGYSWDRTRRTDVTQQMAVKRVRKAAKADANDQQARSDGHKATAAAPRPHTLYVLTADIDVTGSIYVDGHVRLEGVVDGEIRCVSLDLTRDARVNGRIVADSVTVFGTVTNGSIYAKVLVLKPGCSVEAEIYHEHLQLETGSFFDGKSRRVSNPQSLAPLWSPPQPQ